MLEKLKLVSNHETGKVAFILKSIFFCRNTIMPNSIPYLIMIWNSLVHSKKCFQSVWIDMQFFHSQITGSWTQQRCKLSKHLITYICWGIKVHHLLKVNTNLEIRRIRACNHQFPLYKKTHAINTKWLLQKVSSVRRNPSPI